MQIYNFLKHYTLYNNPDDQRPAKDTAYITLKPKVIPQGYCTDNISYSNYCK